jgi:thioredoxin 1
MMTKKVKVLVMGAVVALVAVAALVSRSGASAGSEGPNTTVIAAKATGIPRLVDLGAGKCIPCKAMAPILAQLGTDYAGKLQVEIIDVWQDRAAAEPYRIGMIPTQIFYAADGRELSRHEGFMSREDILAHWKELGVALD